MTNLTELHIHCEDDPRREQVRKHRDARGRRYLNGLDYLEVSDDQLELTVYFLGKLPVHLRQDKDALNALFRIEGGRRIKDIRIEDVEPHVVSDLELDDFVVISVDKPGDFSTYRLRVMGLNEIDPRYDHIDFSFKAGCVSDLDCAQPATCPPPARPQPEINYLAKDYASFRQLILDRLALIMPDWRERHAPDLGLALVEVLAYVGDHLSYYQDAVATEAYLDTARQRISVRRHARLVDYFLHEGCNARAWLCLQPGSDVELDLSQVQFITGLNNALGQTQTVLTADELRNLPAGTYDVFEPVHRSKKKLLAAQNEIPFYTWGGSECCLPRGATRATLVDTLRSTESSQRPRTLNLQPGDVLIFEERIGPKTGLPADANPLHRHAVRLTRVALAEDETYPLIVDYVRVPTPLVEIEWAEEDALPFTLCLSAIGRAPECAPLDNVSVACGNVILVDYGRTVRPEEDLGRVPLLREEADCDCAGHPSDVVYVAGQFRPHLSRTPLTFGQPLPADHAAQHAFASAASLIQQDPRAALPQVKVRSSGGAMWESRYDLLRSGPDDRHFVVELDNDGLAHLRFGDDELGERPRAGQDFYASYRVGNGASGNVGAEAISHLVLAEGDALSGVSLRVRNPLPASGGANAEPMSEAKLYAPTAFRKRLERAVVADDYARLAERNHKVQRAAATLHWTGSWYDADVAIDPLGGAEAALLLDQIGAELYPYRRIGHDVHVSFAGRIPIEIGMTVCVRAGFLRGHVKAALMGVFSNRRLADGALGFFHPDALSFGEGIYLSKLIAAAQRAPGVESVQVTRLQRQHEAANQEIEQGVLPLGPLEVAQLDNDPSFPENGRLVLEMRGGR